MNNEEEIEITNNEDRGAKSDEDVVSQQANDANKSDEGSDDVSFEDVNEEGEVDARTTIKKLREKIKKLEGEKQEYLDFSQRTRADYANFKKEVETNRITERKFATKRFIEELLPVLDSYDMAKGNVEAWEKVDQNWRVGIEYIFGQLRTVLENEGVIQFGKVGDIFNPNLHESMEMVKVENESENDKIIFVLQSGYRMNEIVLRPARVKTGHFEKS
ncbi:TPA: nucleotide exchange factor GrpE [Candidatus Nomurabacteria bacterium]|nr:nucleotide exchange factor GrpE [Candidatus Nomurabacteria bacterium]